MAKYITLFLILFQGMIRAESGNYCIALGEEDKDRLMVLNEIYYPYTREFFVEPLISPGDQILEIGCGIGLVSQEIAKRVGETGYVLATDISEEQLRVAKSLVNDQIKNLEFRKVSAYQLDSLDQKFDFVYVRFLLCHLPDTQAILRQVRQVLKPGGCFIIEDLTGNETFYSEPHVKGMEILQYFDKLQFEVQASDDHYFSKLPDMLKEEGFSVISSKKAHPLLDTLRKRKMLTYNLSSLKDALVNAGKIELADYHPMYLSVKELAEDCSIKVFSYELGQICAN